MVSIAEDGADLRLAPAVEAAAAKIREAWSERERAKRFAYGWQIPTCTPSAETEGDDERD